MGKTLSQFIGLIDLRMGLVAILSIASTYVCQRFGILVDMPLELAGIAIVFPIVFSISQAFQRREAALSALAEYNACRQALVLAHRDWPESGSEDHEARARRITDALDADVRLMLRDPSPVLERQVRQAFSELSQSIEGLREDGRVAATEISRVNQYLRLVMVNIEQMRNISVYRTPRSLRSFTRVFLTIFPIIFGPYFAFIASASHPAVGYVVALLYATILVGLDNIQEELENPYDGIGTDDISLL